MFPIALALLLLPRSISTAPTAIGNEPFPTPPLRQYSPSTYGRCSNWNPFQCRVTEIITHTVIQHYTSTVYVAMETRAVHPTVTLPYDNAGAEAQAAYISAHHVPSIAYTACESVIEGEVALRVSTSIFPEMTTVSYHDPDCADCVYHVQNSPRTTLDEVVSILAIHSQRQKERLTGVVTALNKEYNGQEDKGRPTDIVSIWEGAGMITEPSVSITKPHHELKQSNENLKHLPWDSRPQCFKRIQYHYTATFDDLHVPYIPKSYHGLTFSDHFSVFEPSLLYGNYTAPSPPYAVQSYPSRFARITSLTPFNLMSMYVGCEYTQTCLIRIRGWSPYRILPTAEMQVRVTRDNENWTFVMFSNSGFNQITLLEFDVLDLNTGSKGTLGVTLDQIRFNKEVFEMQDCFE